MTVDTGTACRPGVFAAHEFPDGVGISARRSHFKDSELHDGLSNGKARLLRSPGSG